MNLRANQTANNTEYFIYNWTDISGDFSEGLILGNGASVAIHPEFLYESLYVSACKNGFVNSSLEEIFGYFRTTDFEFILRMLWHSYKINQALKIDDQHSTTLAYKNLRNALIQSVQSVHVEYESVYSTALPAIAEFLKRFKTIVSLNYDLLVYWAMMYGNEHLNYGTWFKDGFLKGKFDNDWRRFREPHRKADGATLVFYPHGNLSLGIGEYDQEYKIHCAENQSSLLSTIIQKWSAAECVPLFVSEGLTTQKVARINASPYLQTVYNEVLPELGQHVAIYGWSISDRDVHILKAMKRAKKPIQKLAISIHETGNIQNKCKRITEIVETIFEEWPYVKMPEIYFFAASSENCWNKAKITQHDILSH
jgi:hypothetical protein